MSTVLIVLGIWFGASGVVLLPICALLKVNRERIEAETDIENPDEWPDPTKPSFG